MSSVSSKKFWVANFVHSQGHTNYDIYKGAYKATTKRKIESTSATKVMSHTELKGRRVQMKIEGNNEIFTVSRTIKKLAQNHVLKPSTLRCLPASDRIFSELKDMIFEKESQVEDITFVFSHFTSLEKLQLENIEDYGENSVFLRTHYDKFLKALPSGTKLRSLIIHQCPWAQITFSTVLNLITPPLQVIGLEYRDFEGDESLTKISERLSVCTNIQDVSLWGRSSSILETIDTETVKKGLLSRMKLLTMVHTQWLAKLRKLTLQCYTEVDKAAASCSPLNSSRHNRHSAGLLISTMFSLYLLRELLKVMKRLRGLVNSSSLSSVYLWLSPNAESRGAQSGPVVSRSRLEGLSGSTISSRGTEYIPYGEHAFPGIKQETKEELSHIQKEGNGAGAQEINHAELRGVVCAITHTGAAHNLTIYSDSFNIVLFCNKDPHSLPEKKEPYSNLITKIMTIWTNKRKKQYNLTEDDSCKFCSDTMEESIMDSHQHALGECIFTRELNDQLWATLKQFWDKNCRHQLIPNYYCFSLNSLISQLYFFSMWVNSHPLWAKILPLYAAEHMSRKNYFSPHFTLSLSPFLVGRVQSYQLASNGLLSASYMPPIILLLLLTSHWLLSAAIVGHKLFAILCLSLFVLTLYFPLIVVNCKLFATCYLPLSCHLLFATCYCLRGSRKIKGGELGGEMINFSRRETFSAAHRLHNPQWSAEQNASVFGKCNNANFHGHNYVLEVTVRGEIEEESGMVMNLEDLKKIMQETVMNKLDHKNLDLDVEELKGTVTTTENLAVFIFRSIKQRTSLLYKVKLWETEKNVVTYKG
ncbi:6-pyruvoyl tetrahydrobiopterin synthase-like [Planoprotostelium fungivorum]|uniref:6-pyruvoyl tetrahydrobiopterin synthase n=1 Tax=Planoprotostelium fungivorum TaxID=1890364 RepID=A0A2P6NV49_9EUKA|nr:6-pyruvoyl tetrahydrobiopterin synthase-like [Planoprotostelium fungivorum]